MLFNSYEFLFAFLPLAGLLFWWSTLWGKRPQVFALGILSAFFYAYWSLQSLPLLLLSILVNFSIGRKLNELATLNPRKRKGVFAAGILFNLLLISYFKYAAFLAGNLNALLGALGLPGIPVPHPGLPIGISFFTFTQIAYLADTYKGTDTRTPFERYFVFVTYFPHLIAGPILHYRQLIPQLSEAGGRRFSIEKFGLGLFVFGFGLAKKVLVADTLAPIADAGFNAAQAGEILSMAGAWTSCLAYTLQIYFDFSGYSDMAVGISLFFGIYLPVNFASPYKATSIIDFWRRWHISLSAFLRDYVYIPLGGNRLGRFRRYLNVLVTMLIGGLWHGANWTFVLWGFAHGFMLAINHLWRESRGPGAPGRISKMVGWMFTFFAVAAAWVLFRAESVRGAILVYRSMFNLETVSAAAGEMRLKGIAYVQSLFEGEFVSGYNGSEALPLIALGLTLCLLLPPVVETRDGPSSVGSKYVDEIVRSPAFRVGAIVATALAIYASTLLMAKLTPFLYFQF